MLKPLPLPDSRARFALGDLVYFINRETGREVSGRIIRAWSHEGWPHYDVRLTSKAKSAICVPQICCTTKPVVK